MNTNLRNDAEMACPIQQMTPDEIVCYLEGGYANPIQRAIELHTQYCNACHEAVEAVRDMRATGRALLASAPAPSACRGPEPGLPALDEVGVAAYLDGAFSDEERQRVERHLGRCPSCYRRVTAAEQELNAAPGTGYVPERALAGVRTAAPWSRTG